MSSTTSTTEPTDWLASDDGLEERSIARTNKRLRDEADEMQQRANRMLREAHALSRQSEELRDQADYNDAERPLRRKKRKKFDEICALVRSNDSSLAEVDADMFPIGYARPLGNAMLQNTYVSSLGINLERSIPDIDKAESSWAHTVTTFVDPLVQTVGSSKCIREVLVYHPHQDDEINGILQDLFLGACLRNQHIKSLAFTLDSLSTDVFRNCRPSTALTDLAIYILEEPTIDPYLPQELQAVSESFQFFPSLTNLTLRTSFASMTGAMLSGAQAAGCPLNEIELESVRAYTPEISSVLAEIMRSLGEFKHLCVGVGIFDAQGMVGLTNALQGPDNAPSVTGLIELSLFECSFDKDAVRLLQDFMHTRVKSGSSSSLKKLKLDYSETYDYNLTANDWVTMLSIGRGTGKKAELRASQDAYPTIGSLIETLALDNVDASLLMSLANHGHLLRLQELIVVEMQRVDIAALAKCITTITTLRTFSIHSAGVSLHPVLVSLRESDNVQSLTTNLFSGELMEKLATAYCERNRHLDNLLEKSSKVGTGNPNTTHAGDDRHRHGGNQDATKGQSFCPTLWQTAYDMPNARSTKVIRSLLGLCESIAPVQET